MGFPDKAIEAALRSYRHGQVSATQDDRQVARLLGIAARRRRERSEDHGLTHDSLALKLGEGWPDARYVAKWGRWLFWDEARWATDETRLHMTRCRGFFATQGRGGGGVGRAQGRGPRREGGRGPPKVGAARRRQAPERLHRRPGDRPRSLQRDPGRQRRPVGPRPRCCSARRAAPSTCVLASCETHDHTTTS